MACLTVPKLSYLGEHSEVKCLNKSTKQERSNYSNGIHAHSVIKKLKEINTFWRANNSGALARGTHSLAASIYAGQRICSKLCSLLYLSCTSVLRGIILSNKFWKNSGTIDMK